MAEKIDNKSVFFNPFSANNPVVVQVLASVRCSRSP